MGTLIRLEPDIMDLVRRGKRTNDDQAVTRWLLFLFFFSFGFVFDDLFLVWFYFLTVFLQPA